MKRIALMTGGNSGEYEISLKTADNIYQMLDKDRYEPYLIHLKGNIVNCFTFVNPLFNKKVNLSTGSL